MTSRRKRTVRLDHFLPFLCKAKKGQAPNPDGLLMRLSRRVMPSGFLSDPLTGKPGLVRRLLRTIGPTAASSPLRRLVQTVSLVGFLWLFLYVCWPYSAAPQPPGRVSPGWQLLDVDQATGQFRFRHSGPPDWPLRESRTLHVVDANAAETTDPRYVGPFHRVTGRGPHLLLEPARELTAEQLDMLLLKPGPWSMHEREPNAWPSHYADDLAAKEAVPAELFLVMDPLVSLSTAIASRSWVWSLACAAIILAVCLLIPRGFCGYVCPLGTLIDMCDWALGRRVTRFRVPDSGWWVHIKYYLLLGVLICALCGVLISGYVAAIPVLTRGMLLLWDPLQTGVARGWHLVPPSGMGHAVSWILFLLVLGLGLLQPRFWCKYVCPSGAVFSLANVFRLTQRHVEASCIHCNKCVEICPFDAIKPDFTTRTTDCTFCQTCGGVCPTHAIKFVQRFDNVQLKVAGQPPTGETPLGRRGFLSLAAGSAAAVVGGTVAAGATHTWGARLDEPSAWRPVRPPGSVPETEFLQMCIRCGECFKACPNHVLHVLGFQQGWQGLWTPHVNADWAGCESSCNACGQVCPTGAIRALPLEEKRAARMGLAVVNPSTCLPMTGREACQLCVDECHSAGYHAIEFRRVHTQVDGQGLPLEGSGFLAPAVLREKCVGCGLCQTRCFGINVDHKRLLSGSAIVVEAGAGKEDRLRHGSYRQLRQAESRRESVQPPPSSGSVDETYYVPPG